MASEVLEEFKWPAPYVLEDWLPDGVAMIFPRCTLMFSEGFESDMDLTLFAPEAGADEIVTLTDFLLALRASANDADLPPEPALIRTHVPHASSEKVKIGIRNLSLLALTFARHCMLGDFSWVESYKAFHRQP
jgi:hypothetical protein